MSQLYEQATSVQFAVEGEPKGKGRPRFSYKTGKAYTDERTVAYEKLVRKRYKEQGGAFFGAGVPICVDILAYHKIPKDISQRKKVNMLCQKLFPTKKPDVDNIAKIILDALNGIAFQDDRQIISLRLRKAYAEEPRVEVALWEVAQ